MIRLKRVLNAMGVGLLIASWFNVASGAEEPSHAVARVGWVSPNSESTPRRGVTEFWRRLGELGWVEGRNLVVERRFAQGRPERLAALMANMVDRKVDVIVTSGTPAAIAAKKATTIISIVDYSMGDAEGVGLVNSLVRPGGNLTGISNGWTQAFTGKWLELLIESVPALSKVAVILNPANPVGRRNAKELEVVAEGRKVKLRRIEVHSEDSLAAAFERARQQAQAAIVLTDPLTYNHQHEIATLALRHRLPTIYANLEFVDAGGLMAYGVDHAILLQRAADYVDKILRGARAGDLPIEQPAKPVMVVNLRTAKAIGITLPESVLLRADEVIR